MTAWEGVPWMGVGQRWDGPQDDSRLKYLDDGLDFLEPSLPIDVASVDARARAVIAHSSELALASTGRLNPGMLECLSEQVRHFDPPWAGEHICLNSVIETGDLGYNFAPILDETARAAAIGHVEFVKDAYGCNLALENGPRYFPFVDRWDDLDFIRQIADATDSAIILDISHHLCTVLNLNRHLTDGLRDSVLERVIELHITGIGQHSTRGYYYDCHGQAITDLGWSLLEWVLNRASNLRAVTIEHDFRVTEADYERDLHRLHDLLKKTEHPRAKHSAAVVPTPNKSLRGDSPRDRFDSSANSMPRVLEKALIRMIIDSEFARRVKVANEFWPFDELDESDRKALQSIPAGPLGVERRGRLTNLWSRVCVQMPLTCDAIARRFDDDTGDGLRVEYFANEFWCLDRTLDLHPYGKGMEMASTLKFFLQRKAKDNANSVWLFLFDLAVLDWSRFRVTSLSGFGNPGDRIPVTIGSSKIDLFRAIRHPDASLEQLTGGRGVEWAILSDGSIARVKHE